MLIHNADITGSLLVNGIPYNTGSFSGSFTGIVAGTTATASYVEYNSVANKPALVSGSSQITYSGLTGIPSGIVSGSAQVTYSGLTGVPSGIVSGSSQISEFGIFATTGSNGFNGSQSITGSLTVTGQVVAQTLNVQQVTSSVVYSSGSNVFGNELGNTQQFTGSVSVTGSLTVAGAVYAGGATSASALTGASELIVQNEIGIQSADSTGPYLRMVAGNVNQNFTLVTGAASGSEPNLLFNVGGSTRLTISGSGATTFNLGSGEMRLNRTGTSEYLKLNTYYLLTDGNDQLLGSVTGATYIYAGSGVSPKATFSNTETTLNFNPQTNLLASYYYLNFGGGSIMYRNNSDIYFGSNAKYGSAGTVVANYTSANGMGLLTMDGGNLRWQANDTSVTAGTVYGVPIRFAINGDGNVGINTDSPGDKLEIKSGYLRMFDPSSGANAGYLIQWSSNNGGTNVTYAGIDGITTSAGNRTGDLRFLTSNAGGPTEKVRILSSGGITFNGDTAAANALDDYEEGTWTPTLPNGGTLVLQSARYVKIGQKVTVSFYITSVTPTNNGSDFRIGGLPFANGIASTFYTGGSFAYVGTGNLNKYLVLTGADFAYIYFHFNNGTGGGARILNSDYFTDRGDGQLIITITYFAAT